MDPGSTGADQAGPGPTAVRPMGGGLRLPPGSVGKTPQYRTAPEDCQGFSAGRRGEAISIRLDQDVLEWFRGQGPGYQTRMNAVLRSYMEAMSLDDH
mgnify:CR=1 FL=1